MLSTKRRIGQTCPDADWQTTLTRHPRLGARRMFSPTSRLPAGLKAEVDAGRLPVVSIKTSPTHPRHHPHHHHHAQTPGTLRARRRPGQTTRRGVTDDVDL